MSYKTYHALDVQDAPSKEFAWQAIAELREMSEDAKFALDADGCIWNPCSWDEMDADMVAISLRWPGFLFVVYGEGEDREDNWKAYYRAGKSTCYSADIVYPEFCEDDLR